jgi:hypothetical protein
MMEKVREYDKYNKELYLKRKENKDQNNSSMHNVELQLNK